MTAGDGIFETNTQCIGVENPTAFGKLQLGFQTAAKGWPPVLPGMFVRARTHCGRRKAMRHPATRFFSASMLAHNRKVTTAQDNDADRETPWIIFRYKKNRH
jgi:hypothetical protein